MELPICRWRGPEMPSARFPCTSPKLRVASAGVTAEMCAGCYCADHEPPPDATVYFHGHDAEVGPLTKYTVARLHDDTR